MSKILVKAAGLAVIAGLAASASAVQQHQHKGPTVTIGGNVDVQGGYQHQKKSYDQVNGFRASKFGLVNDTKFHVKVDGHSHGLKYGGKIVFNADTSRSKTGEDSVAHQTMVYFESGMGRMEAGSYTGAYEAMRVSGATLANATGGIDGDWKYWANSDVTSNNKYNLIVPALPTTMDKSYTANASKVSLYTPSVSGFKAGVTYIPDTDQHGTITNLKTVARTFSNSSEEYLNGEGFRNVVQGGFMYHGKVDKMQLKASLLGEMGSAKKLYQNSNVVRREKLRAYEAGATVHYMGFGVGGSYGNNGKSGIPKLIGTTLTGHKKAGRFYTAGVNYEHSQFGASFGFMNTKAPRYVTQPKLNINLYSVGVDFKPAPGFMPYIEATHFNAKVKNDANRKNRGTIVLAGTKLHF